MFTARLKLLGLLTVFVATAACAGGPAPGQSYVSAVLNDASRNTASEALRNFNRHTDNAVRPGDLVRVRFTLAPELDTEQRVLPSGEISLPYIGLVQAADKSMGDLTDDLREKYSSQLRQPDLTVTVVEYARDLPAPRVFVLGAVNRPGAYEIDSPVTIFEALALAGGEDERARKNAVAVLSREGDELIATIYESKKILLAGDPAPAALGYLKPGDIVFVPQTGLSAAAETSRQIQQLIGFSGYSGSFGVRLREF